MTPGVILTAATLALALVGYIRCLQVARAMTLGFTLVFAVGFGWLAPPDAESAIGWLGAGAAVLVAVWLSYLSPTPAPSPKAPKAGKAGPDIAVDGTNVLFWDGEADLNTLRLVVDRLRDRGLIPQVFLDASTRHHLNAPALTPKDIATALGLPLAQVTQCPAGTEADAFLIAFAKAEGVPILSNDRFGDRAKQTKGIKRLTGVIANGKVIFNGF